MSRLLIVGSLVATLFATSAQAQYHDHWHHYRGHRGPVVIRESGGWIAPLIGGVIVGSIIADANKKEDKQVVVVQQPQTVIVTPTENCTAWKEIQTSDGTTYRERTCYPTR